MSEETDAQIANMARDIREMRSMLTQVINSIGEAECEIPEKMRRFTMYYHDVKDFVEMFHQLGASPPDYILREIERCDDRFRQLLGDLHSSDGGAFEKVRRDMTERGGNRYDHSKLLPKGAPQ